MPTDPGDGTFGIAFGGPATRGGGPGSEPRTLVGAPGDPPLPYSLGLRPKGLTPGAEKRIF